MRNKIFSLNTQTESFHPMPHMRPHIRISPFSGQRWHELLNREMTQAVKPKFSSPAFWLTRAKEMRIFNSGRIALLACLKNEGLQPHDEVLIVKTNQGPYISSCVTDTIELVCRWGINLTERTRAVLVLHEFGFPCPESTIKKHLNKNLIIIEDCAYSVGSRIEKCPLGELGDYAIYSLPKYYPIPLGGILSAKKPLKRNPSIKEANAFDQKQILRTIQNAAELHEQWNNTRIENWNFYAKQLRPYNLFPYHTLKRGIVPGVYLTKLPNGSQGDKRKKHLNAWGVEATEYYGQEGFYFPIHQFLTEFEKFYILDKFINFQE